jgi:hypothetical protein
MAKVEQDAYDLAKGEATKCTGGMARLYQSGLHPLLIMGMRSEHPRGQAAKGATPCSHSHHTRDLHCTAAGVEPPSVWPSTNLPRCVSCAGLGWQARWFRQQRGIARYNCADSLDRTNVGSFFGAVQVGGWVMGAGKGVIENCVSFKGAGTRHRMVTHK